jgi:hypothetical protein
MIKEGGKQKFGDKERPSEQPKKRTGRKVALVIFLIVLFLALAWLVLAPFRHNWSNFFVTLSQNESDQKQKAIDLYKSKILAPMSSAPYVELGKLAAAQENYAAAENDFKWALQFNNKDSQIYFYLIDSLINQGKISDVNQYLDQVQILDPNNPEIIFVKARIAIKNNQLSQAESLLAQISDQSPKYKQYYILILLSEGKFDIIKKGADQQLNLLVDEIKNSQNPIYKKARLGLEWIKLGEKSFGCNLVGDALTKDKTIKDKLTTWQPLFKTCNL